MIECDRKSTSPTNTLDASEPGGIFFMKLADVYRCMCVCVCGGGLLNMNCLLHVHVLYALYIIMG